MLCFSLHCLSCGFIAIGLLPIEDSWIQRMSFLGESAKTDVLIDGGKRLPNLYLYVTSLYYITTTITTIGYGDIFGVTLAEKLYIIVLMFLGILVFTAIQQRTSSIEFDITRLKVNQAA